MSGFLDKTGLAHLWEKMKSALSLKQDKLSAGDNITIIDNRISATTKFFYGTCATASATAEKAVECSDWQLEDGNAIVVRFANVNTSSSTMYLNVNGTGAIPVGPITNPIYFWRNGSDVVFVYDSASNKYVMANANLATTGYYGFTKLSTSVSSTSQQMASTPSATKKAYDLANNAYSMATTAEETAEGKQDKLTAGTGITIQDNVISAEASSKQSLYVYDIAQSIIETSGYKATVKNTGTDVEYSGYNGWSLKVKKQRILAPDFTSNNPYSVILACVLIADDNTYGCSIPFTLSSYNNGVITCSILANTMFAEDVNSSNLIQYHRSIGISTSLTATQNSVF